jgi:uncharacterized membrane protein YkgB
MATRLPRAVVEPVNTDFSGEWPSSSGTTRTIRIIFVGIRAAVTMEHVFGALPWGERIDTLDRRIATWMDRWGVRLLRYSLGLVFVWFGAIKPLGTSPANELVARTVYVVPPDLFVPFLGVWEVAIGLCLIYRPLIRIGIGLMALQMVGTFMPLVLLPHVTFEAFPHAPTLEGQYIVKNLVMISAAIVVGGTVRDEEASADPSREAAASAADD